MTVSLAIKVSKGLHLKDPEQTDLGRRIVGESIPLLLELGFDKFTFKKLGERIKSPEASVYRYFSSKHQLLHYLIAWYWNWLTYLLKTRTLNVSDTRRRLKLAISVLVAAQKMDISIPHIDESKLHAVIISEGSKAELESHADSTVAAAVNSGHTTFCEEFASLIHAYKRSYPAPKALVASLIVASHRLMYLGEHFPRTIEVKVRRHNASEVAEFLEHLLFSALEA